MWSSVVLVALTANNAAVNGGTVQELNVQGSVGVADSANFHVESATTRCDARVIARCCEQWREHLQAKWLGDTSQDSWTPRCHLRIHGRRESYQAAIGRGLDQSFGSSWVNTQDGRISDRRIDLLLDPQDSLSAFAHELTHVVLADAFAGSQLPLWANEGIAILADSAEKQKLHRRDLNQSIKQQVHYHCAELVQLDGYPPGNRVPAFYGQSASLVGLLTTRGGSEKMIPFLKKAMADGYDKALRETYGIHGLADLHREWVRRS